MSRPTVNLDINRISEAPRLPENATIAFQPAPSLDRVQHGHYQPRFFLGPMPTTVVTQGQISREVPEQTGGMGLRKRFSFAGLRSHFVSSKPRRSFSSEESVSRKRAFIFFIRQGGRPEDFASQERSVKEEILRRVRRTRWFEEDRQDNTSAGVMHRSWVGDTFEIGKDLLGLSTLAVEADEPAVNEPLSIVGSSQSNYPSKRYVTGHLSRAVGTGSVVSESVEIGISSSRPNNFTSPSVSQSHVNNKSANKSTANASSATTSTSSHLATEASSSRTRLFTPPAVVSRGPSDISETHSDTRIVAASAAAAPSLPNFADNATAPPAPGLRPALRTDNREDARKKPAKVTFPEEPGIIRTDSPASEQPAAPEEVLTREPTPTTSAGAAAITNEEMGPEDGKDVLMRGMGPRFSRPSGRAHT